MSRVHRDVVRHISCSGLINVHCVPENDTDVGRCSCDGCLRSADFGNFGHYFGFMFSHVKQRLS